MKNHIWNILLIIIFMFPALISCQNKPITEKPEYKKVVAFRDKLYDVTFTSPMEAWAVGYPGVVIHTLDAGKNWSIVDAGIEDAIFGVDFPGPSHGWIVGQGGAILNTLDGGKSWISQDSDVTEHIFSVDFIDEKNGWAVGNFGTMLNTDDGGVTWESTLFEPMANASINAVCFINHSIGWIAGEYPIWDLQLDEEADASKISNVFRTIDGGKNWERQDTGVVSSIYDIHFKNETKGWAVGSKGTIISTEDGGLTWKSIEISTDSHFVRLAVIKDALWVVGTEGAVFKVINGKANEINLPVFTWISGIAFNDQKHGILVGGRGTLLRTEDGGREWRSH